MRWLIDVNLVSRSTSEYIGNMPRMYASKRWDDTRKRGGICEALREDWRRVNEFGDEFC